MNIKDLIDQVHANAVNKGFWDTEPNMGEKIALCHSELSEALEALRMGDDDNFKEELADTVIRIFDLCGYLKIDLETEIIEKHKKNLQRPAKHGKKF